MLQGEPIAHEDYLKIVDSMDVLILKNIQAVNDFEIGSSLTLLHALAGWSGNGCKDEFVVFSEGASHPDRTMLQQAE